MLGVWKGEEDPEVSGTGKKTIVPYQKIKIKPGH